MATLFAIQQPELINGVVFSSPSILPPVGFILVRTHSHSIEYVAIMIICPSSVALLV